MAVSNKYSRWYADIITSAINRKQTVEGEKHHILPRSFKCGGEKDKLNIVKLTYREHFICHLLLARMVTGWKQSAMASAVVYIYARIDRSTGQRSNPYASKHYTLHRKAIVSQLKHAFNESSWINDGINSKRINVEHLQDYLDRGWNLGRTFFTRPKVKTVNDGKVVKRVTPEELADYLSQGWVLGRLQSYKDKITVTDGKVNKRVDPSQIPAGFQTGSWLDTASGRRWATDGETDVYLKRGQELPVGFSFGRSKIKGKNNFNVKHPSCKGKICITDGVNYRFILNTDVIPDGWSRGSTNKAGYKWKKNRATLESSSLSSLVQL